MKRFKLIYSFYFFSSILLLWNCASIKPPPGGPIDETPPEIIAVTPPSGTINLNTKKITIEFSEYMDEGSFKNNISIFPRLDKQLDFKFRGNEVILTLPDSLDRKNTYIIYLNRNIKDEHGVSLARTIQLAYSTGKKISNSVIKGKIYGTEQISVHLWKINKLPLDSLFATQPDYITDISEGGFYSFSYLAPDNYQILALDKSGAGLPLNTDLNRYGLHWQCPLNLSENDTLSNINMRLWKEPQKLKLLSGEWSAFTWGKLIFNSELSESITVALLLGTENGVILDSMQNYLDPSDKKNLIIQSANSLSQKSLKVNIIEIKCENEILLDSSEVLIQVPQEPDTSYLKILEPIPNFQIFPDKLKNKAIDIIFSKPIQLSKDLLLIPKLLKNDSTLVEINIKQINPMQLQLIPVLQWEEDEKYQLKINKEGIIASGGRGIKDSVLVINLRTAKSIGYGSVIGTIDKSVHSNLAVELFSVKNPSLSQTSFVNSKSEFEFKSIPEGNYLIYFFKDSDNDMKYSFGNAYPNIPSEWFYFYPDTFEVRANWETEIAPVKFNGLD